jgi:hypothetical protein
MVEIGEFERIRVEICTSGPASDGENLLGMEIDCCAFFGDPSYSDDDPGLWEDMEVRRSEGAKWLIAGRAVGRRENAAAIAAELGEIWDSRLRYHYRSAHTVSASPESIALRAVTQIGPGGIWVTANVEVALA